MEQLEILTNEIIKECDDILKLNSSPNISVVKVIKHEFEVINETLLETGKVVVLNRNKDLWAMKTIIDSAWYEYDKLLFKKVFEFNKLCKKLSLKNLKIIYE